MWFDHVSLLHGWLPHVVAVGAWAALVVGICWWRRAVWHWLIVAAAAGAVVLFAQWALDVHAQVGTYPRSFVLWVTLPVFAFGAALWQWTRVGWPRRVTALVAVPLMVAFGGLQIDAHYGYIPTIGDLLGAPLPGQISARQLPDRTIAGSATTTRAHSTSLPWRGAVASVDIPALVSHFDHRPAYIWVPPIAFATPRPVLPVLMLLSGTPGSPDDWLRAGGALSIANEWAAAHRGVAPIMVMPDVNGTRLGDTECVDGPRGNSETYLTVDVRAYMHEHFGVSLDPHQWAVAGLSEGGTCALDLAVRHPHLFSTFADFSGDPAPTIGSRRHTLDALYGGAVSAMRAHKPTAWFARDAAAGLEGVFAVGSDDRGHLPEEEHLAEIATTDGMNARVDVIRGGGHDYYTWARALRDTFDWIVERLGQHVPSSPTNLARGARRVAKPHES